MKLDRGVVGKALEVSLPLIIADAATSIIWIIDAFFVGMLGYMELAGLGAASYLLWLVIIISNLIYMGAFVIAGQARGARKDDLAVRVLRESLGAAAALGVAVAAATYMLAPQALQRLSGDAWPYAWEYTLAWLPGIPIYYVNLVYDAGLRSFGMTRPIMVSVLAGSVVNAVLDPILIFGYGPLPAMGVKGAAYASVVAGGVSLLALTYYALALPGAPFPQLPGSLAFKAARVGFPSMVERLVFVSGNLLYLGAVAYCGEEALAAHTIGVRVESIAFMPLFSIATAAGALVSWEVGAGRISESKTLAWELLKFSTASGAVIGLLLAILSPVIPRFFTEEAGVAGLATVYLVIAGLTEPMLAVAMSSSQIIRSAGDTRTPTIVNTLGLYTFRVLPALLLVRMAPEGACAIAAWLAMALDVTARAAIMGFIQHRYYTRLARKLI